MFLENNFGASLTAFIQIARTDLISTTASVWSFAINSCLFIRNAAT